MFGARTQADGSMLAGAVLAEGAGGRSRPAVLATGLGDVKASGVPVGAGLAQAETRMATTTSRVVAAARVTKVDLRCSCGPTALASLGARATNGTTWSIILQDHYHVRQRIVEGGH